MEALETVVEQMEQEGRKAAALQLDMRQFPSLDGFVENLRIAIANKMANKFHFDYLINNAGMGATVPCLKSNRRSIR